MSDKTGISWTSATWNPFVGCSLVSPGCTNCYAQMQAARIVKMNPGSHYEGTVKQDSGLRSGKQGRASDELWNAKEYPA